METGDGVAGEIRVVVHVGVEGAGDEDLPRKPREMPANQGGRTMITETNTTTIEVVVEVEVPGDEEEGEEKDAQMELDEGKGEVETTAMR